MSIIIVTFPGAPQPPKEDIDRDTELNESIEKKIKG
jgi:hypothetical protein